MPAANHYVSSRYYVFSLHLLVTYVLSCERLPHLTSFPLQIPLSHVLVTSPINTYPLLHEYVPALFVPFEVNARSPLVGVIRSGHFS